VIINPGRRDVRMAEPFLHLGDIGLVIKRVGRRGGPERVGADGKAQFSRISAHELINAIGGDRLRSAAFRVVAEWPKQRAGFLAAVSGQLQVIMNEAAGGRMQRHIAGLAAFAGHFQVRHAAPFLLEVFDFQLAQFLAPQRVIEQGGQNRLVAERPQRRSRRRVQQLARLVVAERRGAAFETVVLRPLDAFHRIMGDRVFVAQIIEQRGQRR